MQASIKKERVLTENSCHGSPPADLASRARCVVHETTPLAPPHVPQGLPGGLVHPGHAEHGPAPASLGNMTSGDTWDHTCDDNLVGGISVINSDDPGIIFNLGLVIILIEGDGIDSRGWGNGIHRVYYKWW